MRGRWTGLALVVMLSGCAGLDKALEYETTTYYVQMPDDRYRIFEHPQRDRIMTTPSIGTAVAIGTASGLTLGMADIDPPELRHEKAARQYLDQTNRAHCRIVSGYLVVRPQYEFKFDCAGAPPAATPADAPSKPPG
jgi:hypothetical protein